jgi:hypothetical protein
MLTNIGEFFKAVWSFAKGEGWNFEWTGLTDGFKSAMTDLPVIASREMSVLEKALTSDIGRLTGELAQKFRESADKNSIGQTEKELAEKTKQWLELQKAKEGTLGTGSGNTLSTESNKKESSQSKAYGTFSAFGIEQMGSQSPILSELSQIRKYTQKVADNTEDISDEE